MELIAQGRSCDVFALDGQRVLRRCRHGAVSTGEVAAMRRALDAGYPVPEVHSVTGPDLVLDRVDGSDLLSELGKRPWRCRSIATTVADLQLRLRDIGAGAGLRPVFGGGTTLVHGDLHPGNVIAGSAGPTVIDWENAGAGPVDADAAIAWLLISIADPGPMPALVRRVEGWIRRVFLRRFLALVGRPSAATVQAVCAQRLTDHHMSPAEHDAIRAFAARHG